MIAEAQTYESVDLKVKSGIVWTKLLNFGLFYSKCYGNSKGNGWLQLVEYRVLRIVMMTRRLNVSLFLDFPIEL